jgi:uncharacterized membrane protein YczE
MVPIVGWVASVILPSSIELSSAMILPLEAYAHRGVVVLVGLVLMVLTDYVQSAVKPHATPRVTGEEEPSSKP